MKRIPPLLVPALLNLAAGVSEASARGAAPTIVGQPTNRVVALGGTAVFSVIATGAPPLSYRWFKDGAVLASPTNPSLVIASVTAADEGFYFAEVSNPFGTVASRPAHLSLETSAPVITAQPASRSGFFGGSASFGVTANGALPFFYRWLKDGELMPDRTSRLLTVSNLVAADAGFYSVIVSNSFGSVTSQPASLRITGAPPSVSVAATNVLLCAGGAAIYASAFGSPTLSYQWWFSGVELPGPHGSALAVPGNPASAGDYSVVVTNPYGSATSAVVTVELGPRLREQPDNGTWLAGSPLTLRVIADACRPRYQWRFNGADLPGQTNYQLHLPPLTLADAGDYTVVVADTFRTVTSAVARLEVEGRPPVITREPVDVLDFWYGTNAVSFSVGFTAAPQPSFQWRFNGLDLPGQTNDTLFLPPTPERQGGYSVMLSNEFGSVTSRVATFSYRADVLPPMIHPQGHPVSQALCPQARVVVLGVITENPPTVPLFFQWRKDGVELPGATERYLSLEGGSPDAGDYTVVITNAYGAVISRVASVSLAPVIRDQPSDQLEVPDGTAAYFYVGPDSCVPHALQWQRNGTDLPGATNTLLHISPATLTNAGDYRAVIRNSYGAVTSRAARLEIIQIPPAIVPAYPFDAEVEAGQDAYFDVAYSAAPPPTFQWRFNGVDLPGETNEYLRFPTSSTNQSGGYSVVLSNVVGVVTSRVAQLTVIVYPPEIEEACPLDQTVAWGDYANFYVNFQAAPFPAFQWRFNGVDLPGETNEYLQFMVTTTNQSGGYSVVLSNAAGVAASRVAQLTVTVAPPEIVTQPRDLRAVAGDFVDFRAHARGAPPPLYQWQHNGVAITGATNNYFYFVAGFSNQQGGYSMVASNEFGSVTSRVATLIIELLPPLFITQPRGVTVVEGGGAAFYATLFRNVPAYFQWQLNGSDLPGATNQTLRLFQASMNDAGGYRLVAWNDIGRATSDVAMLTVRLPDALDRWRWRHPVPQGNHLYSVAHDGTRFIAVGDTGALVSSTNGVDWADSHVVGDTATRTTVAAGNGVMVSLTYSGLLVSTNGVNWSQTGPEAEYYPRALAFGAGRFVALGEAPGPPGEVILSVPAVSTNGRDWKLHPPVTELELNRLTFTGGRFLAASPDWRQDHKIWFFTSLDGEIWMGSATAAEGNVTDFAFGNGTYVGISSFFGWVSLSPGGTNWTPHLVPQVSEGLLFGPSFVAFGAGRFVAVGPVTGRPYAVTSTNGLVWSFLPGTPTNGLWDITFAAGRFAAVGVYGTVASSADGLNWINLDGGSDRNFRDIARGGGLFVAVGNQGMLFTSSDGTAWTERASGTSNNLRAATYFKNRFVVVGEQAQAGATVLTSGDGVTWRRSTAPGDLFGLAHNDERLVAVGDIGMVATSTDGLVWSSVFSGANPNPVEDENLNAVTWGGGRFVAVGRNGAVMVSSNGVDWASTSFGSRNWHGVAYGSGLYVAVARGGWVASSLDATNWQARALDNADSFSDVGFGGGQFLAVGDDGEMFSTTNGLDWLRRITPSQFDLRAVLYAEGGFYIAGDNETILQSLQTAPALRITWLPTPPPGRTRIELLGEVGRPYRLQVSENLKQWTDLYSFTASREVTYFTECLGGTPRGRFHRVVSP
jgi:hypothetical protein